MSRQRSTPSRSPAPAAEPVGGAASRSRVVPAVQRACSVLWLLSRHAEGMILSHVARELDILPSTCLHILRELAEGHLVSYNPRTKLYALGGGILTLARELTQRNPFVLVAQPWLNRLSREFEVGASAQERDGDRHLLIVTAASLLPGDLVSPGARRPLFTSATGRLMAAWSDLDDDGLRQGFLQAQWQDPPDFAVWLKEVRAVRRSGYAVDEGQFRKGVTVVAAPVVNPDGTVDRAISITAISAQLDAARRKKIIKAVQVAAAEISGKLR